MAPDAVKDILQVVCSSAEICMELILETQMERMKPKVNESFCTQSEGQILKITKVLATWIEIGTGVEPILQKSGRARQHRSRMRAIAVRNASLKWN